MNLFTKVALGALVALACTFPYPHKALSPAPVVAVQKTPERTPEQVYWDDELARMKDFMTDIKRPSAWADSIVSAARAERLSPWLIAAIISVESDWQATRRGNSGEYGLMQVMPGTAAGMARSLGMKECDPMDPDTNIRLGAHYLSKMVKEYGNHLEPLAAYNGGPGGRALAVAQQYAVKVMGRKVQFEERWVVEASTDRRTTQ